MKLQTLIIMEAGDRYQRYLIKLKADYVTNGLISILLEKELNKCLSAAIQHDPNCVCIVYKNVIQYKCLAFFWFCFFLMNKRSEGLSSTAGQGMDFQVSGYNRCSIPVRSLRGPRPMARPLGISVSSSAE